MARRGAKPAGEPERRALWLRELWNRHFQIIRDASNNIDAGSLDQAQALFQQYYVDGVPLPVSSSPQAELIARVHRDIGERAAVGAVAAMMDKRFDANDPMQARGVLVAHEFLSGTGRAARESVQKGLSNLLKRLSDAQRRAEDKADELDRRTQRLEELRRSQFQALLRRGDREWRAYTETTAAELTRIETAASEHISSILAQKDAAIDQMDRTRTTYEEHMRLKAPVTYWRDNAKKHRCWSRIAAGVGLVYAALLLWYGHEQGVTWFKTLVTDMVSVTKIWQVAYAVVGVAVFLLTILFWIGRLVSRIYVSQTHLAIDADERAVMVETYLALAHENKIQDSERVLVLGSLFRASSDGLVKDDGSPDMGGFAGLFSRAGAGGGGTRA